MRDIKEAFKKATPITGRTSTIAKELYDEIQKSGETTTGETLDFIIKEAAESLAAKNELSAEALDALNFWRAIDNVEKKFNTKEA